MHSHINEPSVLRRWVALSAPFSASSISVVLLPVELAERGLLEWAAAGAATWAVSQGVGSFTTRPIIKRFGSVAGIRVLLSLMVIIAMVTTIAVSLLDGSAAGLSLVIMAVPGGIIWSLFQVANRSAVAGWGNLWIRRAGPTGRVSAAISAVAATALAVSPLPLWLGVLLALGLFGSAVFTREFAKLPSTQIVGTWSWNTTITNGLMALAGWGPVALYVLLVALTAGPIWAGAAMAAYAAGAILAPWLSRKAEWARSSDPRVWVILSAATVLLWIPAGLATGFGVLTVIAVLFARLLSGAVLFVIEGSADVEASRTTTFASAYAGRNIATAVVGAIAGSSIAAGAEFWTALSLFIMLGAVAIVSITFYQRRSR